MRFGEAEFKLLQAELDQTRTRLAEVEESLSAFRNGEVDALVVSGPNGDQIFTLTNALDPHRCMIEEMSEGTLTVTDRGLIVYANHAFARLVQKPLEGVIGTELLQLAPSDQQARLEELLRQAAQEGVSHGEVTLCSELGGRIPFRLGLTRLTLLNESVLCVVATDLTEQKRVEEEQRLFQNRLFYVQKMESLGTLTAGMAHNFNNMLAAILGTASLHELHAADPTDREAFRVIIQACKRGRELVKSLSQFTLPTLSSLAPVEVHDLLGEVEALLAKNGCAKAKIVHDFHPMPLWVNGDAGALIQVFQNLCLNSLDAISDHGTITLKTCAPNHDWVHLFIADNGEGMTPDILAKATEPFFTTKPVGKGTGLGLSMAHGLIKALGGTLGITSHPGQGTCVEVRLPRLPRLQQPPEAQPEPLVSPLDPMNILVVDDDRQIQLIMERMLTSHGHRVTVVSSGEEALDCLRKGMVPELVLLDQNMPGMNGIQTMLEIRFLHRQLPILICSGQPDIENWSCFKLPFVAVIAKPFDLGELREQMARIQKG